tara:strand:+ start:1876 stop:2352 length:477 start_codon:yes stop_codon:yes gene_type:complete
MAIVRDLEQLSTDVNTARAGWFNSYQFGNLGMINASHNTNYPLIHFLPPSSAFVNPYKNDETMTCVFHCYQIVEIARDEGGVINPNQAFMLERTYDLLLEQFKGTMEALSLGFEHRYILTGMWGIERVNEEFNDGLVGLICTVQINKFTHCLLHDSSV